MDLVNTSADLHGESLLSMQATEMQYISQRMLVDMFQRSGCGCGFTVPPPNEFKQSMTSTISSMIIVND